jgi:hypothetical protein
MTKNTTNHTAKKTKKNSSADETATATTKKAPLTYLILGVGRSDPGNYIECLRACQESLGTIPVLHYAVEEALWPHNDDPSSSSPPMTTQQCLQTVQRIMEHCRIDLLLLDDKKRTILSLLVMKKQQQPLSSAGHSQIMEETVGYIVKYLLQRCPELALVRDKRKRLPLHLACDVGWTWTKRKENEDDDDDGIGSQSSSYIEQKHPQVLQQVVQANPLALEVMDPKVKIYPFALATDLTTIYNLLQYQPGVLAAYR